MDGISATARWTAAARASESLREDALFVDELAEALAGPEGFARLERYANPGTTEFLAVRTRYLDEAISAHPRAQVVLVAAGLDTRSVRLNWPPGTMLYELDQPELIAWKEKRLAELSAPHGCERQAIGTDLTGEWDAALRTAGWDPAVPTLWIAEGLLFYLDEPAARTLLTRIAGCSAPDSVLVGDLLSHQSMISEFTQDGLARLRADGCPWRWGTDEPEDLLAACGWSPLGVTTPGDEGAHFGRWPWPPLPREVLGFPRNFLFTATVRA